MFELLKKEIKKVDLESSYIKKGEKTKLGGAGEGGIYRDKTTGKDYLMKRMASKGSNVDAKRQENWRSWDEILAARFLKAAGVLVPNMFAVEDKDGLIYVASSMLPGVKNCPPGRFKKLPSSSRDRVLASQLMHCWLGNRDLINTGGENFVVDRDDRVFNVDLGASLFSGFRRIIHGQDDVNFSPRDIHVFLLDRNNDQFGVHKNRKNEHITAMNVKKVKEFFSEYLSSAENERKYHLQGALMLASFRDSDIETLVKSTGHTEQDKKVRIEVLIARRLGLLEFMENKYGKNCLEEERLSLSLQRIFHKNGIYNRFVKMGGSDALVSFRAQYTNAVKPEIVINPDGTVSVSVLKKNLKKVAPLLQRLSGAKPVLSGTPPVLTVTMPIDDFKAVVNREIIENSLQIFFSSFGYLTSIEDDFHRHVYKGDGHHGFRSQVSKELDAIKITLPPGEDYLLITETIANEFHIDPATLVIENDALFINGITLEQLAARFMHNTGARKVAVISEDKDGKILAGKLDASKKGVSGFATAGGGSEHPYNPLLAAREEGADEFGYSIKTDVPLIAVGSTLPNKRKNIFLAPPEATSAKPDLLIGYKEFQDGSIKYYSFKDFRAAYAKDKTVFDRTSIYLYLRHYQREIQKVLIRLGIENVLVQISKSPDSIGKIYLKPSIENYDFLSGKTRAINKDCLLLMQKLLGIQYGSRIIKKTDMDSKNHTKNLSRECIEINESIDPARFHCLLVEYVNKLALTAPDLIPDVSDAGQEYAAVRAMLIGQIENYLYWRENKNSDDGRGYKLGIFTKLSHFSDFGKLRAEHLKQSLMDSNSAEALFGIIKSHFNRNATVNNPSLDTYLLEGIAKYPQFFKLHDVSNPRNIQERMAVPDGYDVASAIDFC